jgi:hypothetical protein
VLDLLREENYYLASYAEYDRMVKERERRERQKERMYKDLQENGRTR